jgi:predicted nicotinamide N-methyase
MTQALYAHMNNKMKKNYDIGLQTSNYTKTENPEIDSHVSGDLVYDKYVKAIH